MTDAQVVYEHSSTSGTIDFYTNDLRISHQYEAKGVVLRDNRDVLPVDANRVTRVFEFSAVISTSDFTTLEGQLRPSSAPDYTSGYPRLAYVRLDGSTTWTNVTVIATAFSGQMVGPDKWLVRLKFVEHTA